MNTATTICTILFNVIHCTTYPPPSAIYGYVQPPPAYYQPAPVILPLQPLTCSWCAPDPNADDPDQ